MMRCFGSLGGADRVCDLCSEVNFENYKKCKHAAKRNEAVFNMSMYVRSNCPYRRKKFDEMTPYTICTLYPEEKEVDCGPEPKCVWEFEEPSRAWGLFKHYGV